MLATNDAAGESSVADDVDLMAESSAPKKSRRTTNGMRVSTNIGSSRW